LSLRTRRSELVDLLRRTQLFRQAEQSSVRQVVESATLAWFESGTAICREREAADEMFVIVSGEIVFSRDGATDALRRLHRGDFFGEVALVQGSPRTATALAATGAEVLILGRDAFDTRYRRSAPFRQALRTTAELRLESDHVTEREPAVVWLVNETNWPAEQHIVDALRACGVKKLDSGFATVDLGRHAATPKTVEPREASERVVGVEVAHERQGCSDVAPGDRRAGSLRARREHAIGAIAVAATALVSEEE